MFSDSQAKKFDGKKWRNVLPVTNNFTDGFFTDEILGQLFSSKKVFVCAFGVLWMNEWMNEWMRVDVSYSLSYQR